VLRVSLPSRAADRARPLRAPSEPRAHGGSVKDRQSLRARHPFAHSQKRCSSRNTHHLCGATNLSKMRLPLWSPGTEDESLTVVRSMSSGVFTPRTIAAACRSVKTHQVDGFTVSEDSSGAARRESKYIAIHLIAHGSPPLSACRRCQGRCKRRRGSRGGLELSTGARQGLRRARHVLPDPHCPSQMTAP